MADTIAALATAPGTGGIAIVRVSGERAREALMALIPDVKKWNSHQMMYGHVVWQGETVDECMAVLMCAPRSYTREDVAELHLHGGSWAAERTLQILGSLGIRAAEPGEFTKRAFLNGRVDLSQAEAVMAIISAEGERAARAAMRQLQGGVSGFIRDAQNELTKLLAGVAAALDYPEEISFEEAAGDVTAKARALAQRLENACDERGARVLSDGLAVVLCGRPNVGKSSLLNALARQERAIVTDIPGTTRDIVTADVQIKGLHVHFSDTAGIREQGDVVEQLGVARARQAIMGADVVLVVLDGSAPLTETDEELLRDTEGAPRIIVLNKCDQPLQMTPPQEALRLSAVTGEGIAVLENAIAAYGAGAGEGVLTQERHMALAREAAAALRRAADACELGEAVDVAAVELHEALYALGRVTGDQVDERLLDDVFATFCVGK